MVFEMCSQTKPNQRPQPRWPLELWSTHLVSGVLELRVSLPHKANNDVLKERKENLWLLPFKIAKSRKDTEEK